jgi:hypothetical protein
MNLKIVHEKFLNCSKRAIWENLTQESICKVPSYDLYYDSNQKTLRECANEEEGKAAIKKLNNVILSFVSSLDHFGCPVPCEKVTYNFNLNTIHLNSLHFEIPQKFTETDYYLLIVYYRSFMVEKQVETLVYDFGGFLAAAGGNLGLCLGLSCLSILFTFTQWAKAMVQLVRCPPHLQKS